MAGARTLTTNWKVLAIPNEHGGWGFTMEPVVLGLLVAPSIAGLGLGLLALASFFARHPTKIALGDLRRGKVYARTKTAIAFAVLYGLLALAGLVIAWVSGDRSFVWPLLLALPFAIAQVILDGLGLGRTFFGELAGALAMGSISTAIIFSSGQYSLLAWGAWLILAVRALIAVRYARAQLRRAHGKPVSKISTVSTALLAVVVGLLGAKAGIAPWMGAASIAILAGYTIYMLEQPPVSARNIGWSQVAFGLLVAVMTAVGIRMGW